MADNDKKRAGIRGSSGLVGTAISRSLSADGWEIIDIGRNFTTDDIKGLDVLINLAGHTINCRWTSSEKRAIRNSRIDTTSRLSEAIKLCGDDAPSLFISASAVGIYPSSHIASPDNASNEYSTDTGTGFLSDLCREWEEAAMRASGYTRVAIIRLGVVISSSGGAFPKLALPFRLGASVRFGIGKQPFSWISEEDVAAAVKFIIADDSIAGTVNFVAPQIIDMNGVRSTLAEHFKARIKVTFPEFLLKIAMGGSHRLVTEGQNVKPDVLLSKMYNFRHKTLGDTLSP
jgi:uncharacterized protein (TIGR01777 family)